MTILLLQQAESDPARAACEARVAAGCATAGARVWRVPHLYHVPEDSPVWAAVAALPGPVVSLSWLHPRPTTWLLRKHGVAVQAALDLRAFPDTEACVEAVLALVERGDPAAVQTLAGETGTRWYPVVDGDRCTHCRHCLQFCLFGVYDLDAEGRVTVTAPDACKPGCPACSRICPQGAIIFPLHAGEPAIAGAPGQYMTPDAAARRMYYARTGLPCPRCGATGPAPGAGGPPCPECGRATAGPPPDDGLDDLIAALDDLAGGKP